MNWVIKIVLFSTLLFGVQNSYAQNYADKKHYLVDSLNLDVLSKSDVIIIDSSLNLYHSTTNDTSKINSLNLICESMMHADWGKYQIYQLEMIENFESDNNDESTKDFLIKAKASALNNIGYLHKIKGEIFEALDCYHKSLKIQEEIQDEVGASYTSINIGAIYLDQEELVKAEKIFQKSLKTHLKLDDKKGLGSVYYKIGQIHNKKLDYETGLEHFKKSLIYQKEAKYKQGISSAINNIGFCYDHLGQYDSALVYYLQGLDNDKSIGNLQGEGVTLNNIGGIYFSLGEIDKAKEYALKSMEIAEKINYPINKKYASNLLSKIYDNQSKNNDLSISKRLEYANKALEMNKLFVQMKDSLFNKEIKQKTFRQEAKYEYEKQKAIDDIENEKIVAVEKAKQEKQFVMIIVSVVSALLILILLIIIYRRLKLTRIQKIIIEETNEELNQTNEELAAQRDEIEMQKNQVVKVHQEIKDSINYAKRIQNAILPAQNLINQHLPNSFVLYKPKDIVAGDFYWQEVYNDKIYIAAADCTGHGVPGAMVSVICSNALTRTLLEEGVTDVGKILDRTREIVINRLAKSDDVKDGMDISLSCFDFSTMEMEWAGANNPLYLLRNKDISIIKGDKESIGYTDNSTTFTKHKVDLKKGDNIYLFTDGYSDQFGGEKGKKMGYKNFRNELLRISELTMDNQRIELELFFDKWKNEEEQVDDVCIIGVKV